MSDDSEWHTYSEGQKAAPADNPEMTSRLSATKPASMKVVRTAAKRGLSEFFAGLRGSSPAASRRRRVALKVFTGMLMLPAAAVILGYITRPAPETTRDTAASLSANSSESLTGEKKAKPAPGKPLLTKAEIPSPSMAPPAPAPALPLQPPTGITQLPQRPMTATAGVPSPVPNAPPPASPVVTRPPYTPAVYAARHDKHFGESCAGQLTLDSSGLVFKCFDDPHGSVQVALNDIEAVDANGIRLVSGKKFHFSISGMAKSGEEELFANWLHRVR
jgi:hypothetical protein